MNNGEALKALKRGKIIKRKDWTDKFMSIKSVQFEEDKSIWVDRLIVTQYKDNPFNPIKIWTSGKAEDNFTTIGLLKNIDQNDLWEEYIPLFDYLNVKRFNGFKAPIIYEKEKFIKELQDNCYDINTAKTLFAEFLTDILYHQIKNKSDQEVLKFIHKFALSQGLDNYNEVIQPLFRSGYCYYFAVMLKDAFNDEGELCLCCPYGHIVWMYKGVPYDIEGIYNGEATLFIPLRFLSTVDIMNFKHVIDIEDLGGELDAEYKASVINTFCDSFLKDLGFGCIFEEALEEIKEKDND